MNEQIRQIADRIRGLREIAQLSQETCAQDLGIPAPTYRSYESGEADIPASFLYQVAGKFHVELSSLLTGEEPRLRVYSVTRAGRGVKVDRRRDYGYQSLAFNFVDKHMEPFLVEFEPKKKEEISFLNHRGEEFLFLFRGRLAFHYNQEEIILRPGDSLYFEADMPHAFRALKGKNAQGVVVVYSEE